jgi:hypothetical protein
VALRKFMERITKPVDELDREQLTTWCNSTGSVPIDEVELRKPVSVSGEVRSVRIVPRAGADALEAAVYDGRGSVTAVFLGRRKIPGISPGRRLQLEGVVSRDDGLKVMYNPLYTLY